MKCKGRKSRRHRNALTTIWSYRVFGNGGGRHKDKYYPVDEEDDDGREIHFRWLDPSHPWRGGEDLAA